MPRQYSLHQASGPVRVLVALADAAERRGLASEIARRSGVALEAVEAEQVWEHIESADVDLAYIDATARDFDGVAMISGLRGHPRTLHLPIIGVCDRNSGPLLRRIYDAGASGFLLRPVDWDVIAIHQDFVLRDARRLAVFRQELRGVAAACQAREAIIAGAGVEVISHVRGIADASAKALRARRPGNGTTEMVTGLRSVEDMAVRIERLIVDALESAGTISDTIDFEIETISLSRAISHAVDLAGGEARDQAVGIAVRDLPEPPVEIRCDGDALVEALAHLIRNAITHAPAGSEVEVEPGVHADGMLTISVTDTGSGMSPDFVARCLTPLAGGPGAGQKRSRIGLGLPLAKAVAEAHGGKLEIRTSPQKGTCAMLVIPADRVRSASSRDAEGTISP